MARADKVMGYTHKGTQWEYQQSWYLLALFSPWTFWFPLVYTGLRTLQLQWIIWGLFYGLPAFIKFGFDPADFGFEDFFKHWTIASLFVAAIHAFRARGEFLVRLASAFETREILMEGARLRQEQDGQGSADAQVLGETPLAAGSCGGGDSPRVELGRRVESQQPLSQQPLSQQPPSQQLPSQQLPSQQPPASSQTNPPAVAAQQKRLFDVNLIGEQALAMLPGLGPERAKQAVAMRETLGSFNSFDHFAEKMGISADARERLRPIFIQAVPAVPSIDEYTVLPDGRRILEVNLASAQAIASLPGLSQDIARRAVALRDADGWYRTTEDFRYRLGLSTDVLILFSPFMSTVKTQATPSGGKTGGGGNTGGRVVDASSSSISASTSAAKTSSGRIVDL